MTDAERGKVDHMFLACDVLGMDFQPNPHGGLDENLQPCGLFTCFLHKNPSKNLSDLDTETKKRMILWPRGTFKTSAVIVEIVQLILNYPNIRILLMSGSRDLAMLQLERVKRVFEEPTDFFERLYPSFCGKNLGTKSKFTVPNRSIKIFAESTLTISTAKSVKSGSHYDVIFIDDLVNDQNYRNPSALEKCWQDYKDIGPVLEPSGYLFVTGTRYSFGDTYERIQEAAKAEMKDIGRTVWQFSIRTCWMERDGQKSVLFPQVKTKDGRTIGHTIQFLESERREKGDQFFACFPSGSPVLRDDWTETSIEDLRVGDGIVGFDKHLVKAKVQYIHVEKSMVIKAITESGRVVLTTPDHKFLRVPNGSRKYGTLELGTRIVSVYKPTLINNKQEQRDMDWLGGILDGEGSCGPGKVTIAQSKIVNPVVFEAISSKLRSLGIDYGMGENNDNDLHRHTDIFELHGGRSLKVRLIQHAQMAKRQRFIDSLWESKQIGESAGRRGGESAYERIVSIEEICEQTVYNIQSSSGNFVCQGFAVKNCQYENNPIASGTQTFTQELLDLHTLYHFERPMQETEIERLSSQIKILMAQGKTFEQAAADTIKKPNQGEIPLGGWTFIMGDLSYVGDERNGAKRDLSVFFVIRVVNGRLYLIASHAGKWKAGEVGEQVVFMLLKYRPRMIWCEAFLGWEAYDTVIRMMATSRGIQNLPLEWIPLDNQEAAKVVRIGSSHAWFAKDKLYIFAGIDGYNELINNLMKWPKLGRHDDYGDCLGLAVNAPHGVALIQSQKEVNSMAEQVKRTLYPNGMPYAKNYRDSEESYAGNGCGSVIVS